MYDSTKGTLIADMPELPIRYFPLVTHELLQRTVLKRMTIRNVLYHLGPHPHPSPLHARSFLPLPQVHRKHLEQHHQVLLVVGTFSQPKH